MQQAAPAQVQQACCCVPTNTRQQQAQHASSFHLQEARTSTPMQQLLPKLQRLELSRCELSGVQPLLQLSTLTSLSSLKLGSMTLARPAGQPSNAQQVQAQPQDALSTALCTLLPHLQHLNELKLSVELAGNGLARVTQQLSCMQQLRNVSIMIPHAAAPIGTLLADLPPFLTYLKVWDERRGWANTSERLHLASLPRQLPQLSSLQEISISNAAFYPSLLRDTPALQRLQIVSCKLLPGMGGDAAADRAAAAAHLAAVGCVKHLTYLDISGDRSSPVWPLRDQNLNAGDPAAYTALTACSALHSLTYAGKAMLVVMNPSVVLGATNTSLLHIILSHVSSKFPAHAMCVR
jgi:hypothetical protein